MHHDNVGDISTEAITVKKLANNCWYWINDGNCPIPVTPHLDLSGSLVYAQIGNIKYRVEHEQTRPSPVAGTLYVSSPSTPSTPSISPSYAPIHAPTISTITPSVSQRQPPTAPFLGTNNIPSFGQADLLNDARESFCDDDVVNFAIHWDSIPARKDDLAKEISNWVPTERAPYLVMSYIAFDSIFNRSLLRAVFGNDSTQTLFRRLLRFQSISNIYFALCLNSSSENEDPTTMLREMAESSDKDWTNLVKMAITRGFDEESARQIAVNNSNIKFQEVVDQFRPTPPSVVTEQYPKMGQIFSLQTISDPDNLSEALRKAGELLLAIEPDPDFVPPWIWDFSPFRSDHQPRHHFSRQWQINTRIRLAFHRMLQVEVKWSCEPGTQIRSIPHIASEFHHLVGFLASMAGPLRNRVHTAKLVKRMCSTSNCPALVPGLALLFLQPHKRNLCVHYNSLGPRGDCNCKNTHKCILCDGDHKPFPKMESWCDLVTTLTDDQLAELSPCLVWRNVGRELSLVAARLVLKGPVVLSIEDLVFAALTWNTPLEPY